MTASRAVGGLVATAVLMIAASTYAENAELPSSRPSGAILGATSSPGCGNERAKGGEIRVPVAGVERRAVVRLPAGYDGTSPRPVIIAFHGFTQSVESAAGMFALERLWPEVIAVYPEGLERRYPEFPGIRGPEFKDSIGRGWQVQENELDDRDVAFFDALRARIAATYCVDPARLYLIGFSNGAYFANFLGCMRPDAIAGIAAVSGGMRCTPQKPVRVILFHGTKDAIVDFTETVAADRAWRRENECAPGPENRLGCFERESCRQAAVVFCAYDGGHQFDPSLITRAVEFFRQERR